MTALPPCPYALPGDDDLTGVVTRMTPLSGRGGRAAERDPNAHEVRWLLEAGLRALGDGVLTRGAHPDGPVAYEHANGLFDALPLDKVMASFRAMCTEQGIDAGSANKARIIRRWSYIAHYQLDLVAYLFRPAAHEMRMVRAEEIVRDLVPALTFGELVDGIVEAEVVVEPIATTHRLQCVLRMMFPDDPAIRDFAARNYRTQIDGWSRIFASISAAYGLPLASDNPTFTDLSTMLGLVMEGAYVRATGTADHATCTDGTPVAQAVIHQLVSAVTGRPWPDLAPLRSRGWPTSGPSQPSATWAQWATDADEGTRDGLSGCLPSGTRSTPA